MQPPRVPPPRDDTITRPPARQHPGRHTVAGDGDSGHWYLRHIALPDGPGDFTPYQTPDYAEHAVWPPGAWLEALAEILGPNHAQSIARCGLEAGQ